jgi:bacteriorhodopsin
MKVIAIIIWVVLIILLTAHLLPNSWGIIGMAAFFIVHGIAAQSKSTKFKRYKWAFYFAGIGTYCLSLWWDVIISFFK